MRLRRKDALTVRQAIDGWRQDGLVDAELATRLGGSIEEVGFDWRRLARISFLVAVLCLAIAGVTAFADEELIALINRIVTFSGSVQAGLCAVMAVVFFGLGARRMRRKPDLHFSNEAILFLGVLSTAGAVALLGDLLASDQADVAPLLLLSFLIYAALGLALSSNLIWVFALLALGSWMGAESGYASGWGAYYLGMNYPIRFSLFGGLLTASALLVQPLPRFEPLRPATKVMGLLYLFISLWLMSIFGNYGDVDSWEQVHQIELLHWSLLFAAASGLAIYLGLRRDDDAMRGFGLTFLLINLYTRFFELFWNDTHKVVFFAILAGSFWLLGRKAEAIWTLGGRAGRRAG